MGMSVYRDWIDWLGDNPFEVAKPEDLIKLYRGYEYELINMTTTNRLGCNQLVFKTK